MIFLHKLKQASAKKETNQELTKDNEGMVVLTQKGENENLTKNIFRVMRGNERLFTLIKPQGNNRVTTQSLPPNFMAWLARLVKSSDQTIIQIIRKNVFN